MTKNNKAMVKAMDYLNITQLEIEDRRNKLHERTFIE
jgi:hypothetical protein